MEFISQPWHWAVSGFVISLITILATWMGKSFGVSSTFRNFCSVMGAGKKHSYFNIQIKDEYWRFAFIAGAIIGGFIAMKFLQSPDPVAISSETISHLSNWNIDYPKDISEGAGMLPTALFNLTNLKGVLLAVLGGLLIGFGARYADGCTSGHAITGLSHLQLQSLLAVIGFFIGGLLMTHLIMPLFF